MNTHSLKSVYRFGYPWGGVVKVLIEGMGTKLVRLEAGDLLGKAVVIALADLIAAGIPLPPTSDDGQLLDFDIDFDTQTDCLIVRRRVTEEVTA